MFLFLRKLKEKVLELQYDDLGVFASNRYFHIIMQVPCWLCLWPFKWDKNTHRLVKENRLFKRILRFILNINMYGITIFGSYQFFYAEEYRNEPWFPNQGDHIIHMNYVFIIALGIYCHISANFGDKTLTDFVDFIQQFDHDNDGKLVHLNS